MDKQRADLMSHLRQAGTVSEVQTLRKAVLDLRRAPVRLDLDDPASIPKPVRIKKEQLPTSDSSIQPDPVIVSYDFAAGDLPEVAPTITFGTPPVEQDADVLVGNFYSDDPHISFLDESFLIPGVEWSLTTDAPHPSTFETALSQLATSTEPDGRSLTYMIPVLIAGAVNVYYVFANSNMVGEINQVPVNEGTPVVNLTEIDVAYSEDFTSSFIVGKDSITGPYGVTKIDHTVPDTPPGNERVANATYGADGQHGTWCALSAVADQLYIVVGNSTGSDLLVLSTADLSTVSTFVGVNLDKDIDVDQEGGLWGFEYGANHVIKVDYTTGDILQTIDLGGDDTFVSIAAGSRYRNGVDRGYLPIYVLFKGAMAGAGRIDVYNGDDGSFVHSIPQTTGADFTHGIAVVKGLPPD